MLSDALRELRECGFIYCTGTGRLKLTGAGIEWCQSGCQFDHEPTSFDLEVALMARSLFERSVPAGVYLRGTR